VLQNSGATAALGSLSHTAAGVGGKYVKELPDDTHMFSADVSWETKLKMLRLAKIDAWHNGQTRFSRYLFRWETLMGLRTAEWKQDAREG
jgi:hypothetical protein